MFGFFLCFEEKGGPKHKEFTAVRGPLGGGLGGGFPAKFFFFLFMPFFGAGFSSGPATKALFLWGRVKVKIEKFKREVVKRVVCSKFGRLGHLPCSILRNSFENNYGM